MVKRKIEAPRVVGLAAGAGGMLAAANMLGMNVVGNASNWERHYSTSVDVSLHIQSFLYKGLETALVKKYLDRLGKIDILCGNPPCQGFSLMSRAGAERQDFLNQHFVHFCTVPTLLEEKPEFVIWENVPGVISSKGEKVFEESIDTLRNAGYNVQWHKSCALDYNLPQSRNRVFFCASLNHDPSQILFLMEAYYWYGVVGTFIGDLARIKPSKLSIEWPESVESQSAQKLLRGDTEYITCHFAPKVDSVTLEKLQYIEQGGWEIQCPEALWSSSTRRYAQTSQGYKDAMLRLHMKRPSSTIMGSSVGFHPILPRRITVREQARLMTYPDNWVFVGSQSEQFKQIGLNTMPLWNMLYFRNLARALKWEWESSYIDEVLLESCPQLTPGSARGANDPFDVVDEVTTAELEELDIEFIQPPSLAGIATE